MELVLALYVLCTSYGTVDAPLGCWTESRVVATELECRSMNTELAERLFEVNQQRPPDKQLELIKLECTKFKNTSGEDM